MTGIHSEIRHVLLIDFSRVLLSLLLLLQKVPAGRTMQGNRGYQFASPSNGSPPYALTRVVPVRSPPPLKSPPPPPARPKPLAPPPSRPPAARLPEFQRRQQTKQTYIFTGVCFGVFFLVLILVLSLSPGQVLDGETPLWYCMEQNVQRVTCFPSKLYYVSQMLPKTIF